MSELEGEALDLAVARALGHRVEQCPLGDWMEVLDAKTGALIENTDYSTNWASGGPIIEREQIDVWRMEDGWYAGRDLACATGGEDAWLTAQNWTNGPTPLIAAMRCFVASKAKR
jgi:hypothetical protein